MKLLRKKQNYICVTLYPFHETTEDIESDSKIGQIDVRYYTQRYGNLQSY